MKTKSADKGAGEAASPSVHSPGVSTSKNVVIPGTSVVARRSANIQKAQDGSLIYKRRQSLPSAPSTPDAKGAGSDALVSTRSQGKEASRSRMSLPVEKRSDRKRMAEAEPSPSSSVPKRRRTIRTTADGTCVESDAFCWICHRDGVGICCELCPRLYHIKCLGIEAPDKEWICPECEKIMIAENIETRSKAMSLLSMETLCTLLKFVLQRMKYSETDAFQRPVDCALIPTYTDYIFNAMDFSTLERNIKRRQYGSTEAFVADVKWILHNCIVFNDKKHRLTTVAKTILKICRHETNEIEVCPDCYMNSCVKQSDNWFCEPCRIPHTLVWAKMKGYPFWPAKVLREDKGLVDVRFFGEHDRAWVAVSQIFLMSELPPTSLKNRKGFEQATEELHKHVERIREKFGSFEYAPHRTPYDPNNPYSKVDLNTTPQRCSTFKPKKLKRSKQIAKVRNPDEMLNIKPVKVFMTKLSDKPASIALRKASAVRLKYSGIKSMRFSSGKRTESLPATQTVESAVVLDSNTTATEETEKIHGSETVAGDCLDKSVLPISSGTLTDSCLVDDCKVPENEQSSSTHLGKNSTEELEAISECKEHDDVCSEEMLDCQSRVETPLELQTTDIELLVKETSVDTSTLANKEFADSECAKNSDQLTSVNVDVDNAPNRHSSAVEHISDDSLKKDEVAPESCNVETTGELNNSSDQKMTTEFGSHQISSTGNNLCRDDDICGVDPKTNTEICLYLSSEAGSSCTDTNLNSGPVKSDDILPTEVQTVVVDVAPNKQISMVAPLQKLVSLSESSCSDGGAEKSTPVLSELEKSIPEYVMNTEKYQNTEPTITTVDCKSSEFTVEASGNGSGGIAAVDVASETASMDIETPLIMLSGSETKREGVYLDPKDGPADGRDAVAETLILPRKEINVVNSCTTLPSSSDSSAVTNAKTSSPVCSITTSKGMSGFIVPASEGGMPSIVNTIPLQFDVAAKPSTVVTVSSHDEPASPKLSYDTDADSLLMEVECEHEAEEDDAVVIIEDDVEESVSSSPVKIKNIKSLQLPKPSDVDKLHASNGANVSDRANSFVPNAPGLPGSCLPTMPSLRSPLLYRSSLTDSGTHVTPSFSLNRLPSRTTRVPPMRETLSGTGPSAFGAFVTTAPSATNSVQLTHNPVLDFGNLKDGSDTRGKSTATTDASSFVFNIAGFDYSKYTNKVINSTKSMLQEFCLDMINAEAGSAIRKHLQLELERINWRHEQELNEIRHNAALQLAEVRLALEHDKEYSLTDLRQKLEEEKNREIEEVKRKQWCANCGKEAIFYCCWNTSYCNYPCQQAHWPKHMHNCTQAPEGSQSNDQQANNKTDERTVNVTSGQQHNWKDNIDLSVSAALKQQQEWDRQGRLTYPTPQTGHQYISNQNLSVPSARMASSGTHFIGSHQQQIPVVQVPYSFNTSIHVTPFMNDAQQSGNLLRQPFRLRSVQQQQQQPIIMYPSIPTAVLTTRHGNQPVQRGSGYQPNNY